MLISGALISLGLTESVHASMDAVTVSTKPVTDLDVALSFSSNVSAEVSNPISFSSGGSYCWNKSESV